MNICLYGSGSKQIPKKYTDEAYKLGQKIAENNHTLIFGGGNTGMMGACAKGVHDNHGQTIGIAPKWISKFEQLYDKCDKFIYVNSMNERKQEFLNNSDIFIITPGGIGTLDEFFEIITLKKLKQHDKLIILFNIHNYYNKMLEMLNEIDKQGFLYKQKEIFKIANSLEEINNMIK